jgi:hypothetical protein
MGKPPAYDPVSETEYLVNATISDAEADEVLRYLASTFDPERDRLVPGTFANGPRVVNFAPVLVLEQLPLNYVVQALLRAAEKSIGEKVEIEFAITIQTHREANPTVRVGFLQVRPIVVSHELISVSEDELHDPSAIVTSNTVLGNGTSEGVVDIVYVCPDTFSAEHSREIAQEIGDANRRLREQKRPYLLIGFGRWGSTHPSLGIPVDWSQISGARTIVESTLPNMNVDFSQGSHFFHNLSSFEATYFMLRYDGDFRINWEWLRKQALVMETNYIRHVRCEEPLSIRVDGRQGRGVIYGKRI